MGKLNLDFILTDYTGKKMEGDEDVVHCGKFLANFLGRGTSDQPVKFFDWAIKLYNKQEIDLDKSDIASLRKFVTSQQMWNASKAQILQKLDDLEKAE